LLLAALPAHAGPRAKSVEECVAYADLALVAATLAKHDIGRDKAETMLPDMYELVDADAREIARGILDAAYRSGAPARSEPRSFAASLGDSCIRNQGRMDSFLGVSL
jgi:hypothetical protein